MYTRVDEVDWYYMQDGKGEPLVFLHGGLDSCENYKKLFNLLKAKYSVLAIDRRGHGRSYDNTKSFDYEIVMEEVVQCVKGLGYERFTLLGYSDGANIGLHLGHKYPELLKCMVLVSPNYCFSKATSKDFLSFVKNISVESIERDMPEIKKIYEELNPSPNFSSFIAKTKATWIKEVVIEEEHLKQIKVPSLIVGGDRDFVHVEHFCSLNRFMKNSSLFIVPQMGHFLFLDTEFSISTKLAIGFIEKFIDETVAKDKGN